MVQDYQEMKHVYTGTHTGLYWKGYRNIWEMVKYPKGNITGLYRKWYRAIEERIQNSTENGTVPLRK